MGFELGRYYWVYNKNKWAIMQVVGLFANDDPIFGHNGQDYSVLQFDYIPPPGEGINPIQEPTADQTPQKR